MNQHRLAYRVRVIALGLLTVLSAQLASAVNPQLMLTMSRDDQWFFKAYGDDRDLNGDGIVERSYRDTVEYQGYFHPHRCYRYDAGNVFVVAGIATGANRHYCSDGAADAWSGNFLNWASMTRLDLLRKALYGGYRSTDTAALTVLERTHLPTDGHSFVKYYNGPDLALLTPFDTVKTDSTNGGNGNGVDDTDEGISICNTSYKSAGTSQGTNSTAPTALPDPAPMMRVVKKNFSLWTAHNRFQCRFREENAGLDTNGNNSVDSGTNASGNQPRSVDSLNTPGGNRNHIVRVQTCQPGFFDSNDNLENCKAYGNNLKPEGLLQRYGLDGQIQFGLISGSYAKNISGGVLRKKVGALTDEVNTTDGTFSAKVGSQPGIIRTLNAVRIYGYDYSQGIYFGAGSGDNCPFQLTDIVGGNCRSWGNPMSEIYLEALRYFALSGASRAPTPAFNADDSGSIDGLVQDSWTSDPLSEANRCASTNIAVLNVGANSYDDDQTNGMSAVFGDVKTLTNTVGDGEGISGHNFLVGRSGANTNEFCTAKNVAALGDVLGICPDAPTIRGSYHIAGLAHYAHVHDLRPDLTGAQTLRTFGINVAGSKPVINIPIGTISLATNSVRLSPAFRLRRGGNNLNEALNSPTLDGGGTIENFKVVVPHTEVASAVSTIAQNGTGHFYGKVLVYWDDTEQGADFDWDLSGTIEYRVNTNVNPATVMVTVNSLTGAGGGAPQLFGYVISGTTRDGFHAHNGFLGANFTDSTGVLGCTNCQTPIFGGVVAPGQSGPQSVTYTVSDTAPGILQPPLYYAAKWGGFDDSDGSNTPNLSSEFDSRDTSGNTTANGDGIPDTYFEPNNPGQLQEQLGVIFARVAAQGSAAANSCLPDRDHDGIADVDDNCPAIANADQRDTDGDGFGNRCDADLNQDGKVNTIDFGIFKQAFGKITNPNADFNGDGRVNTLDFGIFKQLFGIRLF